MLSHTPIPGGRSSINTPLPSLQLLPRQVSGGHSYPKAEIWLSKVSRRIKHTAISCRQASVVVLFFFPSFRRELKYQLPGSQSVLPLVQPCSGVNPGSIPIIPVPFFSAGLNLGAGQGEVQGAGCCCPAFVRHMFNPRGLSWLPTRLHQRTQAPSPSPFPGFHF